MIEYILWLGVLFFNAMVHLKLYFRRLREEGALAEDDEPPMAERDSSASSESTWSSKPETTEEIRRSILARSESNPAFDDTDLAYDEDLDEDLDEDDDEPPNLKQRLSQTGSEMMSSCKSLESMVQEQILAPQILAQ